MSPVSEAIQPRSRYVRNLVEEALTMIDQISVNAKSGEQSLRVMNESMGNISTSSREMTGIIDPNHDCIRRIIVESIQQTGHQIAPFRIDHFGLLANRMAGIFANISDMPVLDSNIRIGDDLP